MTWLVALALVGAVTMPEPGRSARAALERKWHALEELKTRRAEESFAEFARQAWPIVEPGTPLVWNWHLDAKCELLQAVTEGHLQHVIINEPPRNSKSVIVSVLWPAWEWGPAAKAHTRWLTISHKASLATDFAVNSRTIIRAPWYQRRWGHRFRLTGDQDVKSYYVNNRRGKRMAFGLDAGVTGEGGNRLLVDDAIDLKDALNRNEIARVNNIWDQSLFSRVNSQTEDAKILCGQRVAQGDLFDHVKEQHDWAWLVLPAEYDAARRCRIVLRRDQCTYWVDAEGVRQRRVTGTSEQVIEDPRTVEGELLNPKRFNAKAQTALRTAGSHTYQAQQQQNPKSLEGRIILRKWVRYYTPDTRITKPDEILLSWDTAVKAKTSNDRWAGQAWTRKGADAFLERSVCDRFSYPEGRDAVKALYAWARERYPRAPIRVLIENTASGPDLQIDLQRLVPGLLVVTVDGDKERRLRVVSPMFEAGNVHVPGRALVDESNYDPALTPIWAQEFIDELVTFPQADGDDRVDACSQALARFLGAPMVTPPPTTGGTAGAPASM